MGAFRAFPHKRVRLEQIEATWRELSGRISRQITSETSFWKRKYFALSPTVLATVRRFYNHTLARKYIENSVQLEQRLMGLNPKHFVVQPVQFFSVNGSNVLERVYPGPNARDFLLNIRDSKFFNLLKSRLKRKGIDLDLGQHFEMVKESLQKARHEFLETVEGMKMGNSASTAYFNIVLLDFDPQSRKVLLAFVDTENPSSIPE